MRCTVHDIPGRLRVKSPALRHHEADCRAAQRVLGALAGVLSVTARPLTGSVVVTYDPAAVSAARLLEVFETHGWLHRDRVRSIDDELIERAVGAGLVLGRAALEWSLSGLISSGSNALFGRA